MMQLSAEAHNLNWLVSNFVDRVPGVQEATAVGPLVSVRQLTKLGPVVLGTQPETGSSVFTTATQVVVTAPEVPAVQFAGVGSTGVGPKVMGFWQVVVMKSAVVPALHDALATQPESTVLQAMAM